LPATCEETYHRNPPPSIVLGITIVLFVAQKDLSMLTSPYSRVSNIIVEHGFPQLVAIIGIPIGIELLGDGDLRGVENSTVGRGEGSGA
jgi:hypothetical protein